MQWPQYSPSLAQKINNVLYLKNLKPQKLKNVNSSNIPCSRFLIPSVTFHRIFFHNFHSFLKLWSSQLNTFSIEFSCVLSQTVSNDTITSSKNKQAFNKHCLHTQSVLESVGSKGTVVLKHKKENLLHYELLLKEIK